MTEELNMKKDAAACAAAFLKRHRMHADLIDMTAELQKFTAEMARVRDGSCGSVKMIPTFIGSYSAPAKPVCVTAIDIGGSHVRCCRMNVVPGHVPVPGDQISFPTPGIKTAVTTRCFFEEIVKNVKDHLDTDHIAICFSLATIPDKNRDAVMVAGGKQLRITDMMGKKVGENFRKAIRDLGLKSDAPITVINDTVAAALGGQAQADGRKYRSFIGFIYGTGTNLCYREADALINVESGAYCGFPTGDLDDVYDLGMIDAGQDRFEKMVSGGYQGGLAQVVLKSAAAEGLITPETLGRIFRCTDLQEAVPAPGMARSARITPADISIFCADPTGRGLIADACSNEREREVLLHLFTGLTRRSAVLCAVTVTGAMLRSCPSGPPDAPFYITAEGSTYLKQTGFKEMLDAVLTDFALGQYSLPYEIHTVSDAVMKGLAAAALSET